MKAIRLHRYCLSREMGTFGILTLYGGAQLYTVEQVWADNQPFVSCLPAGVYQLIKHDSPKYGRRWHLVRHGVVSILRGSEPRYACLFHAANRASELAGCIAPGIKEGVLAGEWAVMDSAKALGMFERSLGSAKTHVLHITEGGMAT